MPTTEANGSTTLDLRVGDVVEVRGPDEILATLDVNGELDALPFMPEMLRYCGQRLTVDKVAHKLCDTLTRSGIRRMDNAVHLAGVRCDGSAHGGCQAACLMYWKHAWLRKVEPHDVSAPASPPPDAEVVAPELLPLLTIASRRPAEPDGTERYRCQATELLRAAPGHLPVRDVGQFVRDVRSGNAGLLWTVRAFLVGLYNRLQDVSAKALPRWLRLRGGRHWGALRGTAVKTPSGQTDLRPGDTVRIRSRKEIEPTLNAQLLNRGMGFDSEMARFCGRTARVARRVDHIIDEHTGKMLHMRQPCIVLEGVVCEGAYNANCPRSITPYWREIWLEKVGGTAAPAAHAEGEQAGAR
jgi:hypothetical protein